MWEAAPELPTKELKMPLHGVTMQAHRAGTMTIDADVLAAQVGDQQAFTRLVEATCTLVSSIALAIVRDPDLSRDIAQDVFLSAWRDLRKLRDPGSFLPWLRQITRHRAYHVLRGIRRGRLRIADSDADALLETVVDPHPDAHQCLVSRETRRLVADTIEGLPVDAREVVTLYYREGQSIAQVAGLLGLGEPAVRQRLSRARASLRRELLERAGEAMAATAPGAAFVTGVAAALTVGAPAAATAAAAATVGTTGLKTGALATLATLAGGATLGAAGGVAGVVLGLRGLRRQTYDGQERRSLWYFQAVSIVVVLAAAAGMMPARRLADSIWGTVAVFVAFIAILAVLYELWLPRILRRRFDDEMRADPVAAARRRRRDRTWKFVGWGLGIVSGAAGIFAGWLASR
jgi:RNA polymerase sigma factor (sigma-70 family)